MFSNIIRFGLYIDDLMLFRRKLAIHFENRENQIINDVIYFNYDEELDRDFLSDWGLELMLEKNI